MLIGRDLGGHADLAETGGNTDDQSWSPPTSFEEYRLLWPLGRGGMGEVYLGHDTVLDRPVAIKFVMNLEADQQARERYLIEARAAARLQHPNVVTIYRVGEIEAHPYIIAETTLTITIVDKMLLMATGDCGRETLNCGVCRLKLYLGWWLLTALRPVL